MNTFFNALPSSAEACNSDTGLSNLSGQAVQQHRFAMKPAIVRRMCAALVAGAFALAAPVIADAKMLHHRCTIQANNQLNRSLKIDFSKDWTLDFWIDENTKKVLVSGPMINMVYGKPIPAKINQRDANSFVVEWSVFGAPVKRSALSPILDFRGIYFKSQRNLILHTRTRGYIDDATSEGRCTLQ